MCHQDLHNPFYGMCAVKWNGARLAVSDEMAVLCAKDAERFAGKAESLELLRERRAVQLVQCTGTEGAFGAGVQWCAEWKQRGIPAYLRAEHLQPRLQRLLFKREWRGQP